MMKGNDGLGAMDDTVLIAYITGELNSDERSAVFKWIDSSEENREYFDELAQTWALAGAGKITAFDTQAAWSKVRLNIQTVDETPIIPLSKRFKKGWYLAASVLILVGAFSIFKLLNQPIENITILSDTSGLVDELEDGSVVTLNANTRIDYPKNFDENERRLALNGEAFFEIARDESKPFIIDMPNQTHVKVLGTSFNIKSNQQDTITSVFVSTGKVEFGTATEIIYLIAGETGYYNTRTGELWKVNDARNGDQVLFWKTGRIKFENAPLAEVVDVLNAIYEDEVQLNCESAKLLSTHETLSRENSLFFMVQVLASVHHLQVDSTKVGTKRIYSLNCDG